MRKDGKLVAIPGYEGFILTGEHTRLIMHDTMSSFDLSTFEHKAYEHDYAYDLEGVGRFRMNVYKTRGANALVGRLLQDKPKSLKELGVSSTISRLASHNSGIIIVSGATGSGKSTTMAGIIDFINKSKPVNIISIEDPIEILHSDAKASISQREIGVDSDNFSSALRSALREDPDVILIGEIRDLETLKTALSAADTGHLVVTTLHTTDTAEAINRILTMFPSEERDATRRALASSLRGVVGQRLVPTIEGGRVAVNEVMVNTPEIAELILDSTKSARDIKATIERNAKAGMQSFEQHFIRLVKENKITLQVAKDNSVDPTYYDKPELGLHQEGQKEELIVPNISSPKSIPQVGIPHPETPAPRLLSETLKAPVPQVAQTSPIRRPKSRNPLG
jgi:twitching motility protein PilT